MNGLSGESGWPNQAPNPRSSWRRSSSSSGVNSSYQAIDASMLATRSAMCVHRAWGGRRALTGCSLTLSDHTDAISAPAATAAADRARRRSAGAAGVRRRARRGRRRRPSCSGRRARRPARRPRRDARPDRRSPTRVGGRGRGRGTQAGPVVSTTTMSARLPTSREPIRSAIPTAAAPPIVAISSASWAPKPVGPGAVSRPSPAARAATRRMSTASPAFSLSAPSATRPPEAISSTCRPARATPWPRRRYAHGQ